MRQGISFRSEVVLGCGSWIGTTAVAPEIFLNTVSIVASLRSRVPLHCVAGPFERLVLTAVTRTPGPERSRPGRGKVGSHMGNSLLYGICGASLLLRIFLARCQRTRAAVASMRRTRAVSDIERP